MKPKHIYVWGYLHQCGGAGPEAGHIIELLRFNQCEVTCVLTPGTDVLKTSEPRRRYFDSIGVKTEEYRPGMLTGKVVWCWCQDEIFRHLSVNGEKPAILAYWPCMNWLTDKELVGLAMMPGTAVLCQSEFQKSKIDQLISAYGLKAKTSLCGTYFNVYSPWNRFRNQPKDRSRFDVIRIGRDDPLKYPENMWELAFRYGSPKTKGFHVVGWGPNGEELLGDHRKADHPYHGKISGNILGHVYDPLLISDMLASSHVTLMYYPWEENAPRVAFEAMASGSVVVGRPAGGLPEFIIDGESGLLCENDEQLIYQLGRLAFDYEAREALAQNAYTLLVSGVGNGAGAITRISEFL
ncbi:MAG: glycosyltransferase family 1 protein [Verrucomicrobia bacterium]|nr:glycosyltransferase family 1 protein [Verrucomicrobiota bacterium]